VKVKSLPPAGRSDSYEEKRSRLVKAIP